LDFHTDSRTLTLRGFRGGRFEVYLNGVPHTALNSPDPLRILLSGGDGGEKSTRVTLYFPAHEAGIMGEVALSDGATVTPHVYSQKILFIGDSITQGWAAEHDPLSYAMRISRALDADCVVQGVGGSYYSRTCMGQLPFDPDTVIVAYGTNDCTKRGSLEELEQQAHACLAFLAKTYAGKRIVVISPIWRCDNARLSVPLGDCRALLCREAERLGLTYVDGLDLVPHDPALFTDGLHPSDAGFAHYAENLLKYLG
jgi:lysophospholipase L1-like esterase